MTDENENGIPAVESAEEQVDQPPEESPEALEQEEGTDTVTIEDPAAQLEIIASERDRLAAEVDTLRDQVLRRQADFDNLRRRVDRERTEFFQYAGMENIRELLPILDDFQRALEAAPDEEGPMAEFATGVQMIYQKFIDALKKQGLEPIEPLGQPFDPNVHHAIETVPTDEAEDHTVLAELQKGYNFKEKLLREAMVKVAVNPS